MGRTMVTSLDVIGVLVSDETFRTSKFPKISIRGALIKMSLFLGDLDSGHLIEAPREIQYWGDCHG